MTQDESIIAVDIRTIEIPNVSGNHLISVAMVRANGGESYVTPVKIPGVLVEDLMEIESRLPYSAEEHFHALHHPRSETWLKQAHEVIPF